MASTSSLPEITLQIGNQGENIESAAPVIHLVPKAENEVSCADGDKDKEKNDISSIIASSLQSVEDGSYVGQRLEMVPAVVGCLQTFDIVGGGVATEMDTLGIVIEEIQITEEVEWRQEEMPLQNQPALAYFPQLCRICAMESHDLISVFGEDGMKLQLAEKIYWHLPIEVKEDDELPLTVCSSCVIKLDSCHDLATSCLDANDKLKKIFNVTTQEVRKEMSNFAATRKSFNTVLEERENSTSDEVQGTENSQDRSVLLALPCADRVEDPCKNLPQPSDQLKEAVNQLFIETANSEENISSKSHRKKNNGHHEDSEMFRPTYDEKIVDETNEGTKQTVFQTQNNAISEDSVSIKSEPDSEPSESILEARRSSRRQRQIKRRFFGEYDERLKYKIAGAMQELLSKDDTGSESRTNKRVWKCHICGLSMQKRSSLVLHQQRKHSQQNFSCSYCDKTFRNAVTMRGHERTHTKGISSEQPPYICEYCGKSFKGKKTLKEHHLSSHCDVKPYKCDKCDKNYGSLTSLGIHIATHSTETPYLCDLCGKSFKHVSNLRSHKRSHLDDSDKNSQVCEVCGKGFRSRFHLSEHMNVHTGRKPYACNVCGKYFHKKIQLRQHGSAHSGMQPYKCPLCGVRFNRRGNMTQHIKRHYRERKYTCRVCSEGFATLGAVLSHRKKHTREEVENSIKQQTANVEDPEQVAYKCEVCGKLLAKKDSLAIHMRTHTGEKPFECGVCGKKLSNKGSLTYHMRSFHTGERPHVCQFCGEGFLSRESRLVHERIHTGEKPYTCCVCGMGFRCSSNLAQHSRVHSDARPHPCPICEKRFQRKGALDVHMRTHTGERPYGCDLCGRRFTQKNDMLKHRRTHTSGGPVQCIQCGLTCAHKRELAKHRLVHIPATQATEMQPIVEPTTQAVLITSADNLISYPEINVPVMENTQTIILHRY